MEDNYLNEVIAKGVGKRHQELQGLIEGRGEKSEGLSSNHWNAFKRI